MATPDWLRDAELADLREARVAEVLGLLSDRIALGDWPDLEACLREFPDVADELRQELPILLTLARAPSETLASIIPGHQLGPYRLIKEIGRGGMGVVYEAEDTATNSRVAVKVLAPAATLDVRALRRFQIEAQVAAQLDHPHIIKVMQVGCDGGIHYYVMRHVDGWSWRHLINLMSKPGDEVSRPALESLHAFGARGVFHAIARMTHGIADALEYAHSDGVVHRDIKPENLLMDRNGEAWIADFGLARIQTNESLTRTGDLVGTLRYMSPEQLAGDSKRIDHRTDIYSLGITLYELLVLAPAFQGDVRPELIQKILNEEPIRPRRIDPAIPVDLETIILKSIQKLPADRYESAGDLAEDLQSFLERRPIRARRPGLSQRVGKWSRRHRRMVSSVGGTVVVAVGIAGGLLWYERGQTALQRDAAQRNERIALEHRTKAELEFRRAAQLISTLFDHIDSSITKDLPARMNARQTAGSEVRAFLESIVRQRHGSREWRLQQGLAYVFLGRLAANDRDVDGVRDSFQQAIQIFQQLAIDFPDDPVAPLELAQAQYILSLHYVAHGENHLADECCREADQHYRLCLSRDPRLARGMALRGWFLASCPLSEYRNPAEAMALAQGAVEIDPDRQGMATLIAAFAEYHRGRFRESLEQLQKLAAQGYSGLASDRFLMSMVYARLGHRVAAESVYRESVAWMDENHVGYEDARYYRAEAARLLNAR